jgi:DNA-binding GntR family transcriptional regulator
MMESRLTAREEKDTFQHKPLKEEIFDVMHKRIIAGKYPPGEWLRQEIISSQLGVSQTPVREALDLLVSAGLAERVPYRGVRVLQLTTEEIVDAYTVRLVLESAAVRAAAINRTEAQKRMLADIVEQTKELVTLADMSTQRQLNREFHRALVAASGNSLLTRLYEMASNQFPDWMLYEYMFRHPELLPSSLAKEYQEHKAIAEAVANGDAMLSVKHAIEHIRNLGNELVSYLKIPQKLLDTTEEQLKPLLVES